MDQKPASSIRSLWQLPALALGMLLLVGGVVTGLMSREQPSFEEPMHHAEALLADAKFEEALEHLNAKVLPFVGKRGFSREMRGHFHALRARAIYHGQRALGLERADNHEKVVHELLQSEDYAGDLHAADVFLLADTYVSLARHDRALLRSQSLPEVERREILHRVIVSKLNASTLDYEGTLRLLTDLLSGENLSKTERGWALARQAELLTRAGMRDEAIRKLLRSMPIMADADPRDRGLLHLILGRAYLDQGAIAEATKQLEWADELLHEHDPNRGETLVLLGRIAQTRGDLQAARDLFARVIGSFVGTPASLKARLGLAEVEAASENDDAAITAFQAIHAAMQAGDADPEVTRDTVSTALMRTFEERFLSGRAAAALRYALTASEFYRLDEAPTPVIKGIADARRRLAEEALAVLDEEPGGLLALDQLDPATREEARRNLIEAGVHYRAHANRVVLSDNSAYADSLWQAADSFDRAGDQEAAIAAFRDYMASFPYDARYAEAMFRLGQAQQARGAYDLAADLYRTLMTASQVGNAGIGGAELGPYGDMSYVPLAQTFLLDADPANDEEAERLLRQVVEGRVGETETRHYREATIALGSLLYDKGRYAEAIGVLAAAVERYADDPRHDSILFRLADSHRLEASSIDRTLAEAMPDQERRALEEARHARLTSALSLYERARRSLQTREGRRRTALEDLYLRNATFYLGACAFDLGRYEEAIHYYDAARERYPNDPSSLVAMIQIVNAYLEQGDLPRAATANERARRFYERFPPDAWNDPYLPLSDREWERWIDSSARLTASAVDGRSSP